MKSAMMFLFTVLSLSFTCQSFATNQKTHSTNVRGAMKVGALGDDLKTMLNARKDRSGAPPGIVEPDADEKEDEQELAANLRKQMELTTKIEQLADKNYSDYQIEAAADEIANETQSPTLGKTLATMWKEMRMFETPHYTKHVETEITDLKREQMALTLKLDGGDHHGSEDCRCIGIDEIEGETVIALKKHGQVSFPADLGARCEAWDATTHPKCPGESWCEQKWCYVDPCKCKNVADLPKPSAYLPNAQYKGKPVHFSYATCGGKDSYSAEEEKKTAKQIADTCAVKVDSSKWGAENCRCVGIGPQPGTTKVTIKGKLVDFPADVGSTCQAWEADNHPQCDGENPPSWCSQSWCYVDPCSCSLATPPKTSNYVPEANYQGKPVYYSYATCGGSDSWSTGRKDACVNQKTSEECGKLQKCGWTGTQCLGKELVDVCEFAPKGDKKKTEPVKSGSLSLKAVVAFAVSLFACLK